MLTIGACAFILAVSLTTAGKSRPLALRHQALDLPGPPAKVMAADLDGDSRMDLVIVVAYTEVEEIGESRIEDLVQVTTVIPALFDRREVRLYLGTESGKYVPAGEPLPLPRSVLHMEPGPPGTGIVALTDQGLASLVFDRAGGTLALEPLIKDPPVLAHTGSFFASLELVHDLDGDGVSDLWIPTHDGLAVYLATETGLAREPAYRIKLESNNRLSGSNVVHRYPLPEIHQVNGDGLPDLVFDSTEHPGVDVMLGSGGGSFGDLRAEKLDCHDQGTDLRLAVADPGLYPWPRKLAVLRDLDGDGKAEAVMQVEQSRGSSFRKEMKDAKRPIHLYSFHDLNDDLTIQLEPYFEMAVEGHAMEIDSDDGLPFSTEQFEDLDGDGRKDLVTITLDFSIFQALRVLATKRISIGLDFHVFAQQADGSFSEVQGLDLSEKLKFDLNDLALGRFAQFAGDFNGDGRQDFVHLGRGKNVTIHTGQPGCRYPKKPDLTIELEEEPASLDLVRIEDLDGDGRSDLRITRPLEKTDRDATAPVRLDLYLSGGAS